MKMDNNVKVLIVDDHAMVRAGLRKILDSEEGIEIVGEAANGKDALEFAEETQPDLVILDVAMPGMGGLETISALRNILPAVKIIILSMYGKESFAQEALRSGAHAYILKGDSGETLVEAINNVLQGKYYFSDQIQETLVNVFLQDKHSTNLPELQRYDTLSVREKQVFRLMMDSKSNTEISKTLEISAKTGEKHRTNIYKKLGMKNSVDIVKYAIRIGLTDSDPIDT
jgi:two-component system response regulator NreC